MNIETIIDKLRLKFLWSMRLEILLVIVAFFLFTRVAVPIIEAIDPTAGTLSLGIIHFVFLGPLVLSFSLVVAWVVINFGFTMIDRWFDRKDGGTSFENDFHSTTPAVRLFFFLTLFLGLTLIGVLSLVAFIL